MAKRRVALIGLGMAVAPLARGLMDPADRVEVAYLIDALLERAATGRPAQVRG